GCGVLLDAYNLECDRLNLALDVTGFFGEIEMANVRELHVAGGGTHKGFRVDVHAEVADANTRAIAASILAHAPAVGAVTFEFLRQAVPVLGHDAICHEIAALGEAFS